MDGARTIYLPEPDQPQTFFLDRKFFEVFRAAERIDPDDFFLNPDSFPSVTFEFEGAPSVSRPWLFLIQWPLAVFPYRHDFADALGPVLDLLPEALPWSTETE